MIPTEEQAKILWDKYDLPENKRRHVVLVAKVARFLASKTNEPINFSLLRAGALLHDIDKNAQIRPGERHPDTGVRILREEGTPEVAELVKTHPLHAILDPSIAPKTWEEKILFLADKMVKYDIITVDERFKLWNDEHLPPDAQKILDRTYPKVKELEKEIFSIVHMQPKELQILISGGIT
ncbi:HDIG domain-containing protein [Candidatus Gottesmanbacteria bacterium]|nr:HDIG domain-containing protein [Candidatus Gottesmanbacteria bacterium]